MKQLGLLRSMDASLTCLDRLSNGNKKNKWNIKNKSKNPRIRVSTIPERLKPQTLKGRIAETLDFPSVLPGFLSSSPPPALQSSLTAPIIDEFQKGRIAETLDSSHRLPLDGSVAPSVRCSLLVQSFDRFNPGPRYMNLICAILKFVFGSVHSVSFVFHLNSLCVIINYTWFW